jgi:hypothetical protein
MYFSSLLFVNRLLLLKIWKIGYRFSKLVQENFVGPLVQWEDHSLPKGRKTWTTLTYMTIRRHNPEETSRNCSISLTQISVFEFEVPRRIFGLKSEEVLGGWRNLHNLYFSSDASRTMGAGVAQLV